MRNPLKKRKLDLPQYTCAKCGGHRAALCVQPSLDDPDNPDADLFSIRCRACDPIYIHAYELNHENFEVRHGPTTLED